MQDPEYEEAFSKRGKHPKTRAVLDDSKLSTRLSQFVRSRLKQKTPPFTAHDAVKYVNSDPSIQDILRNIYYPNENGIFYLKILSNILDVKNQLEDDDDVDDMLAMSKSNE